MASCLVVGGGVVGLSVAYELARRDWRIHVVDQGPLGAEASWAGAGILPPSNGETALHPLDRLRALSGQLHTEWAERLHAETGIDTGYRRCGGLHLARTAGEAALLAGLARTLTEEQIEHRRLDANELAEVEPILSEFAASDQFQTALQVPGECQLRNPRHLQALVQALKQLGAKLQPNCKVLGMERKEGLVRHVTTSQGEIAVEHVVFTTGAWTRALLAPLAAAEGVYPLKGQMVLFHLERPLFRHVINEGPRYVVPRDDGYVLCGSTEEETGFDKSTTSEGIESLTHFAHALIPALRTAEVLQTWAGLRPASFDGFPYIGRLPGMTNAFVAAGHHRSGLHMSTGTAVVLADLMTGVTPAIDLTPFRATRS
jgi:glycine oxidase